MEYEFISTLRQRFDLWERQNQAHPVLRQEFQKIETLREQMERHPPGTASSGLFRKQKDIMKQNEHGLKNRSHARKGAT